MNLENGANTLSELSQRGLISMPARFQTFSLDNLPDFKAIYKDCPVTLVLSRISQGWMNASLARSVHMAFASVEDRGDQPPYDLKKYDLQAEEVPVFLKNAMGIFCEARRGWEVKPKDVRGVSYVSWDPNFTLWSYFISVTKDKGGLAYALQAAPGNPNGWKFTPTLSLEGKREAFEGELSNLIEQAGVVAEHCNLPAVVLEARVVTHYPRCNDPKRYIITDLYAHEEKAQGLGHRAQVRGYVCGIN